MSSLCGTIMRFKRPGTTQEGEPFMLEEFGNEIKISKEIEILDEDNKKVLLRINSIALGELTIYRNIQERKLEEHLVKQSRGEFYALEQVNNEIPLSGVDLDFLNMMKEKFVLIPAFRKIEEETLMANPPTTDGKNVPNTFFRMGIDAALNQEESANQIKKAVLSIFPEYTNVTAKQYGDSQRDLYFDDFPSSHVGTGILHWFNNIFHIFLDKKKILGIEEPEIHLHSGAQKKIFEFLQKIFIERQIVITTHSPLFSSSSNSINLYLIKKQKDHEALINLIKSREDLLSIKTELGFKHTDIFSYDAVWLIEGDSEEIFFHSIAEKKGADIQEKGIKIINLHGKDSIKRSKIQEYLQYLKDTGIKCFVILDKDTDAENYLVDLKNHGLLEEDNSHIWSKGDFEDCFSEEHIIEAMNNLLGEEFTLEKEKMKEDRKQKKTTKILDEFLFSNQLNNLNKPALAEELAKLVKEEDKTEPEEIFRKFFGM